MKQMTMNEIRTDIEILSQLENSTSPENFWCDGEKPRTAANNQIWQRLLAKKELQEAKIKNMFKLMHNAQRKTVMDFLTEDQRLLVAMTGAETD